MSREQRVGVEQGVGGRAETGTEAAAADRDARCSISSKDPAASWSVYWSWDMERKVALAVEMRIEELETRGAGLVLSGGRC